MTSQRPLLTISIPTLNRPDLLCGLLDRLIVQIGDRTDEVEIVIACNNKDTSGYDAVLPDYVEKYHNIHFFKHPEAYRFYNTIATSTHAQGEYIISLADDDCLTDFALTYIIELIQKTQFDLLMHKPFFNESIDVPVQRTHNDYKLLSGVDEYIAYLRHHEKQYKDLISFFSFQSVIVVKTEYRFHALKHIDDALIKSNEFPHEFPSYFNLKDRVIVIPKAALIIGRILNESYPGTMKLVSDFQIVMDYIEKQNDLAGNKKWQEIKKICLDGWSRTIRRGILIKKLGINYKKNIVLKAMYYFYKKFVQ